MTLAKRTSVESKSPDVSPKPGELVPQARGGAIRYGSLPGGPPGPGRPASAIRATLRQSFDERIRILHEIAEGPDVAHNDRLKAIDLLGKYGMGTTQEVDVTSGGEKLTVSVERK